MYTYIFKCANFNIYIYIYTHIYTTAPGIQLRSRCAFGTPRGARGPRLDEGVVQSPDYYDVMRHYWNMGLFDEVPCASGEICEKSAQWLFLTVHRVAKRLLRMNVDVMCDQRDIYIHQKRHILTSEEKYT